VIAPQLWMLAPGVAERLSRFVADGGTLVTTFYSGHCDEANRCFLGGFPGDGLMRVLGVWNEETDWLPTGLSRRAVSRAEASSLRLASSYTAEEVCALVQLRGATSLIDYAEDFYAGTPALTRHQHGRGTAYYQAARFGGSFQLDFYGALIEQLGITRSLGQTLPPKLAAQRRVSATHEYLFLQNFSADERTLPLPESGYVDLLSQAPLHVTVQLGPWDSTVLRRRL
jgi:beta-galactosidase